jgi:hypothetical protein
VGVEWVDLSLASQKTPQNSRLSTIRVCFPARARRDRSPVPTHNLQLFLLFSTSETSPKNELLSPGYRHGEESGCD